MLFPELKEKEVLADPLEIPEGELIVLNSSYAYDADYTADGVYRALKPFNIEAMLQRFRDLYKGQNKEDDLNFKGSMPALVEFFQFMKLIEPVRRTEVYITEGEAYKPDTMEIFDCVRWVEEKDGIKTSGTGKLASTE